MVGYALGRLNEFYCTWDTWKLSHCNTKRQVALWCKAIGLIEHDRLLNNRDAQTGKSK